MFTGIIEAIGKVEKIRQEGSNLHLTISCPFVHQLKIDQSVAHNGACLTVVEIVDNHYTVTAIEETLNKTNLGNLSKGELLNLERCTIVGGRLDGHLVQGHVDQVGECVDVKQTDGSHIFTFRYSPNTENLVVEKGSICINGVSLTVFDVEDDQFSVAIIPYTFENTNFKELRGGRKVNLEFDIIGKYVARLMQFTKDPGAGLR